MAKVFNATRKVNATLKTKTLTGYGKYWAIQDQADGYSLVNVSVNDVPTDIKQYLEGDTTLTTFGVASNIVKICDYGLASFPNLTSVYLFYNGVATLTENSFAGLSSLTKIYVPSDNLATYQSTYSTMSWVSKLDQLVSDYTFNIPYLGHDLTDSELTDLINMKSQAEKNAITKVVFPTDYSQSRIAEIFRTYDFSVFPNLNGNLWYGTTSRDTLFDTLYNAVVIGLGNETTASITFSVGSEFPTTYEEVYDEFNNVFVKIPTMYRKVVAVSDNQITSIKVAKYKLDNDYKPYPCFVKEDGITVMPYILIGKFCMSSTTTANSVNANSVAMTMSAGRTLARNLGTGYQLYDWQMRQLFNDLVVINRRSVNVNANPLLGIFHLDQWIWVDGFCHQDNNYILSYKPSKYVNNPTISTDGYSQVGYNCPTTSGQEIKKLGYDSNNPFFNNVSEVINNSSWNTYYYDGWYYTGANRPVSSLVSVGAADGGLFYSNGNIDWSGANRVRLCYRPI